MTGAAGGAIGGGITAGLASEGGDYSIIADSSGNLEPAGYALQGAGDFLGNYAADKVTGESAHFSWAGLVADAVGSVAGGAIGPTRADVAAGKTTSNVGQAFAGRAVQDVVTREVSVGLGDDHVQSWQQINEDVFGNALGNAAIAGIQAENARNATKPVQASIEINPGSPQLQVSDLNMSLAPVSLVPSDYIVQQDGTSGLPHGTVTVEPLQVLSEGDGTADNATGNDYENLLAWANKYGMAPPPDTNDEALLNGYRQSMNATAGRQWTAWSDLYASTNSPDPSGTSTDQGVLGDVEGTWKAWQDGSIGLGDAFASVGDSMAYQFRTSVAGYFAAGAGAGEQGFTGKLESDWNGLKSLAATGWSDVTSWWDNGADPTPVENQILQLPGEVQNLPVAFGNRIDQDSVQFLNYLRTTSGTQIAYDAGYALTSNAPMIAFAIGTDGFGEVADGGDALWVARDAAVPSNAPGSSLFKLGNVFEDSGVNAAADQAFEQGQMVRRLSVRAFDENGNLLPGRTVLDAFGTSLDSGEFGALEFKLSENTPYTGRQLEHFPYLQ